jgi:hypothetical protein
MSEQGDHLGQIEAGEPAAGKPGIPWWIRFVVGLVALLLAAGAVIALARPAILVGPQDGMNEAVRIYAGYFASRNLAMAIMLLVLLTVNAKRSLGNVAMLVALVQFIDAGMDCAEGRWAIVPGVVVIGAVLLIAAARLSGYPFWKAEAWKAN